MSTSTDIYTIAKNSPEDYYQILPEEAITPEKYAAQQRYFRSTLHNLSTRRPPGSCDSGSPYPLYNAPHRVIEMQTTLATAQIAFTALIREWWSNPQFQSYIPLVPKIERLLRKLDAIRPYEDVGCTRPDILIPESVTEAAKFCEINARFMFNGFFHNVTISQVCDEWDFIKKYGLEGGMKLDDLLRHYDGLMDKSKPVAVLINKGLKDPHCVLFFQGYYPNVRFINPSELRLIPSATSPSGVAITDNIGTIEQFMLELHQEEIEALDDDLLLEIAKVCYNDLRTIYFTHDKRMLGLIRRELPWLLQREVITPAQATILKNGIVETYTPSDNTWAMVTDSTNLEEKDNWVLKKCLSGKGDGMLFGKNMTDKTWKEILKEQSLLHMTFKSSAERRVSRTRRNSSSSRATMGSGESSTDEDGEYTPEPQVPLYLLQRYIRQKKLDFVVHKPGAGIGASVKMKRVSGWGLVASVYSINRVVLPMVLWRVNGSEIIALMNGGLALAGTAEKGMIKEVHVPEVPKDPKLAIIPSDARVIAPINIATEGQIEAVRKALVKYGLAVVETQFEDAGSDYMVNLTKELGEPLSHSSRHGILWDVKPVAGKASANAARSETMESFPWHTDCSFEESPPRFFALHIIHRDRYGGGKLRLVHTDSILENLSPQAIQTLQSPVFKFGVPKEFHKEIDHIVGPLLSTDGLRKFRYRREIIEPVNDEAAAALAEIERSLEIVSGADGAIRLLGEDVMKDNCIVLLDNAKWLHARSPIKDPQRWLRRIRWGPEPFF